MKNKLSEEATHMYNETWEQICKQEREALDHALLNGSKEIPKNCLHSDTTWCVEYYKAIPTSYEVLLCRVCREIIDKRPMYPNGI